MNPIKLPPRIAMDPITLRPIKCIDNNFILKKNNYFNLQ